MNFQIPDWWLPWRAKKAILSQRETLKELDAFVRRLTNEKTCLYEDLIQKTSALSTTETVMRGKNAALESARKELKAAEELLSASDERNAKLLEQNNYVKRFVLLNQKAIQAAETNRIHAALQNR